MRKLLLSVLVAALSISAFAQANLSYYLPDDVSYDSAIPTPKEVLGYEVGEWHVSHDQMIYYMRAIAEASDRAILVEHARSYENRPLVQLIFTSPENHTNLEEIRQEHVNLTYPDRADNVDMDEVKTVLWMGYAVHGNEASGGNAALLAAYYLAAADGEKIDELLDDMVFLLDPCYNPDGFNRFASWVNTHRGINEISPDPNDREHTEAWPGGRTNHYWFDLNRDWLPVQHPESQGRIKKFHEWKPNWLTDHHEMGTNSTFFFQPGIPSRNNPLTPEKVFELTYDVAEYHAQFLDSIGSLYFSKEAFDDYYYGKGSTYPDVNGGVGILFEQGSSRGHLQSSENGPVSFPFTIRNQFVTSLSTIAGVYAKRKDLLEHQKNFFSSALSMAGSDKSKAVVFGGIADKARTWQLAKLISQHDIDIFPLGESLSRSGTTYSPDNSFVVPLQQRQYRLIKAMFEKRTSFQDSLFYDVSTWTLPLAFNIPYAELSSVPDTRGEIEASLGEGEMIGGSSEYAYVFEWQGYYAPRALNSVLEAGLRAKVAEKTFTNSGKSFSLGSILVPVANQSMSSEEIGSLMEEIAKQDGIEVYAIKTGFSNNGVDLGSRSFHTLTPSKILLVVGNGVRSYDAGEVWHLLDQRMHMPVTKITIDRLKRVDLDAYDKLIMPSGSYGELGNAGTNKVEEWIKGGGDLITMRAATQWVAGQDWVNINFDYAEKDSTEGMLPYGARSEKFGAQVIGGSIFQAEMDLTHPIAYGYTQENIPLFRNNTMFMKVSESAYANPIRYTENPLLSGYISPKNLETLSGTAAVHVSRMGRGRIIAFTDNPNFRAFWYGTNKLFMNALLFSDLMD
ncbi:MAG: M14 family zinc carboxypeptidase [Bacteroidota bacterium]